MATGFYEVRRLDAAFLDLRELLPRTYRAELAVLNGER
jgi:hypothetical protein